jgi:hypothetical protein
MTIIRFSVLLIAILLGLAAAFFYSISLLSMTDSGAFTFALLVVMCLAGLSVAFAYWDVRTAHYFALGSSVAFFGPLAALLGLLLIAGWSKILPSHWVTAFGLVLSGLASPIANVMLVRLVERQRAKLKSVAA